MRVFDSSKLLLFTAFAGLIAFVCAPVWSVNTFVNQDGSPHLYNAYLMGQILGGNQAIQSFVSLNPHAIPNLTGHWLLAAMLPIFGAAATTKIFVTALFAIFVGSIVWLRYQTAGREGIGICLLLATALGLNWPWLLGFYNFILAVSALAFTLGLWWRWREQVTISRALILLGLLIFTFFSHLVSFALLCFCLGSLTLFHYRGLGRKNSLLIFGILALTAPLVLNFLFLGLTDGGFQPNWQHLGNTVDFSGIIRQLAAADPFVLMTRRSIPFVDERSGAFALFAPSVWIGGAILLLLWATFRPKGPAEDKSRGNVGWIVVSVVFLVLAFVGPDDFGSVHGGFLRERILLVSLICSVPFLRLVPGKPLIRVAGVALGFVIILQTAVLWEYAPWAESIAKHFQMAKGHIGDEESLGSVIFVQDKSRFRPIPTASLSPLLGIGKDGRVWDNYELGYYLFPVIARTRGDEAFVSAFREASTYNLDDPSENVADKLKRLETLLETENRRIEVLLVWNEQPEFIPIRSKWFETEPYFVSGDLRLYRHSVR